MNRPLVVIAILFSCGIAVGRFLTIPLPILFISTTLLLILTLILSKVKFFLPFSYPSSFLLLPQGEKAGLGEEKNKVEKVYVIGIVTSDPVNSTTHYGDTKSQFYFKPSRLQKDGFWYNVNGSVLVTVYGKNEKYRYGDELVLEGELTTPKPPSNPGGFDYREYLKRRKVYSTIKVENTDLVKRLRSDASNHLAYRVFCFKDRLRNIISSNIDKLESSILRGILWGTGKIYPLRRWMNI